jgi:hypothetical protein
MDRSSRANYLSEMNGRKKESKIPVPTRISYNLRCMIPSVWSYVDKPTSSWKKGHPSRPEDQT